MAKQTFTTGQVLTAAQMTSLQQTAMGGGEATAKTASYILVAADAGTTVIMNSGSATTITVNTALFAAGDTVNIQNIGAGICTITNGTATVNTAGSLALNQYEGGVLYFRSASTGTFFDYVQGGSASPLTTKGDLYGFSTLDARIPIGTNNQILTADSAQALGLKWATPAGGWSLITSGSLSSTTTTVSSISGSYTDLKILFIGMVPANAGSNIYMTYNNTDNVYNPGLTDGTGADTFAAGNAASTNNKIGNAMATSGATNSTQIVMQDYARATGYKRAEITFWNARNGGNDHWGWYEQRMAISGTINRFDVTSTGGNLSGSYFVYGI